MREKGISFIEFLHTLEQDLGASSELSVEKSKCEDGYKLTTIKSGDTVVAQIGYATNGFGKKSRCVRLYTNGEIQTTICSYARTMATMLAYKVQKFTPVPKAMEMLGA